MHAFSVHLLPVATVVRHTVHNHEDDDAEESDGVACFEGAGVPTEALAFGDLSFGESTVPTGALWHIAFV